MNTSLSWIKAYVPDLDVTPQEYRDAMTLTGTKVETVEILDKNLLYVNYCDMDDEEFGISEADKAFTRSFYREG